MSIQGAHFRFGRMREGMREGMQEHIPEPVIGQEGGGWV